ARTTVNGPRSTVYSSRHRLDFLDDLFLRHRCLQNDPANAIALRVDHFNRQVAELHAIAQILDEVIPANAIASIAEGLDLRTLAIEFVLNLTEQLLGDVLEADDAG